MLLKTDIEREPTGCPLFQAIHGPSVRSLEQRSSRFIQSSFLSVHIYLPAATEQLVGEVAIEDHSSTREESERWDANRLLVDKEDIKR